MNIFKRSTILFTLTVFVFSFLITNSPISALEGCSIPDKIDPTICLDDYFGSNDILFYDPNAEVCEEPAANSSSSTTLEGDDNEENTFLYLTSKGLTAEQAAGVMGNFQQESGHDPAVIQGGAIAGPDYIPVNKVGFGIAQWTFTARQAPLVALAQSSGRKVIDLSLQLDFLWQELNTTHAKSLDTLKAETTPERAAYVFHRDFEGSADSESFVIQVRGGNARALYDKYKDLAPASTPGAPVLPTNCGPEAPSTGTGLSNFLSDDFTIFNQCNTEPYGGSWGDRLTPSGGTMCFNACVPTALAMISKNMTGSNVTPNETIDYYTSHGLWNPGFGSYNTSPLSASGAFGLNVTVLSDKGSLASYREVFNKGGLIMALSTGSAPFLAGRHAVVLRGITTEGNFMVADPGRRETNTAPANQPDTDRILTDIRSDSSSVVYAFYKK